MKLVEAELQTYPEVTTVATFVGQGPPRFYLPVSPEIPYPSYGQLVVNTASLAGVGEVIAKIEPWLDENASRALTRVRKYGVGEWNDWQLEARFSGPWNADPQALRELARLRAERGGTWYRRRRVDSIPPSRQGRHNSLGSDGREPSKDWTEGRLKGSRFRDWTNRGKRSDRR